MAPQRRILVGIDFFEPSKRALEHAVALAAELHASLVLVHAFEVPLYTYPEAAARRPADVDAPFFEEATKTMNVLLDGLRLRGVAAESVVRKGPAWEVIGDVAEEVDATYVVVGTHGRRGLPHMILGSVAERVLRTSKRPVIVVRTDPSAP
jgi:nucleotide-binding universal stress UspA family protein